VASQPQPEPQPVVSDPVVITPVVVETTPTESAVIPEGTTQSEVVEPVTGPEEIEMIPEQMQGGMVVLDLPPKPLAATLVSSNVEIVELVQTEPTTSSVVTQEPTPTETLDPIQVETVAGPEIKLDQQSGPPWVLLGALGVALLLGLGVWRFSGR
jgi:hypothetical protein